MFGTDEELRGTADNEIIPAEALRDQARLDGLPARRALTGHRPRPDWPPATPSSSSASASGVSSTTWCSTCHPGTGDIQLTIVQSVALDGAIIVTTPQEVALIDARKATTMFGKVNVPILGLIENMSYFECPSDGVRYPIFGEGGGAREAEHIGVPLLGQIPIEIATRESGDSGKPIAHPDHGDNQSRQIFLEITEKLDRSACEIRKLN